MEAQKLMLPCPQRARSRQPIQATKQQQPPPAETSAMDTVASVIDGVTDVAGIAADILSIFE